MASITSASHLRIELARALTTIVTEENEVVSNTILGVVVCNTRPVATSAAGVADLVLELGDGTVRSLGLRGLRRLGVLSRSSSRRNVLDGSRSRSCWGISGRRSATEVVVLPGDDLTIDSGDDHVALGLALGVEVSVAVATSVDVRRGLGNVALLGGRRVVDGDLLELERTTEVERQLVFLVSVLC